MYSSLYFFIKDLLQLSKASVVVTLAALYNCNKDLILRLLNILYLYVLDVTTVTYYN
jgi:hypothetical protein